jgi:hypothetical protein
MRTPNRIVLHARERMREVAHSHAASIRDYQSNIAVAQELAEEKRFLNTTITLCTRKYKRGLKLIDKLKEDLRAAQMELATLRPSVDRAGENTQRRMLSNCVIP